MSSKVGIKIKSKGRLKGLLIWIIVGAVIGVVIGILAGKYFDDYLKAHIYHPNILFIFLKVYGYLLVFFIGYILHIIVHEFGHLVFGLLTGYSFVSFRIGSFALIKENGKFRLTRYNIPGTAGQCLMMPPDMVNGKFPFVIYNYGGVLMNLIVSILGIILIIKVKAIQYPWDAILISMNAGGILAALTNGIPLNLTGVPNDAMNILALLTNDDAKKGFYTQLRVNGLQSQGVRIGNLPFEMFQISEDKVVDNPLNTSMALMQHSWYLDNLDFEGAKKALALIIPDLDKAPSLFKNETNVERLFLELIGDCDKDFIDELYDESLKKYIKVAKHMIGKKRFLMAYEAFYNRDKNKAMGYYQEIQKMARKYPVKGEADMELMLADYIKDKMDNLAQGDGLSVF